MPWADEVDTEKRYLVYLWFNNGDDGYAIADYDQLNALIPSDGKHDASKWRSAEAAHNWVQGLQGWAKAHYVRHEVHEVKVRVRT